MSDFNTTQGVVKNNVTSTKFRKIDREFDDITDVVELQDGYTDEGELKLPNLNKSPVCISNMSVTGL